MRRLHRVLIWHGEVKLVRALLNISTVDSKAVLSKATVDGGRDIPRRLKAHF